MTYSDRYKSKPVKFAPANQHRNTNLEVLDLPKKREKIPFSNTNNTF